MRYPESEVNISIDIKIDLMPVIEGKITLEQVKTEIDHFIGDVFLLREKYSDWLSLISAPRDWDDQLKNLNG